MLLEYELVSESQSRLWLLLAFSLPQKIEAKSLVSGLGFFPRKAAIRSGIRTHSLHSSRCASSAANNFFAKLNFSVLNAMLSLSSCANVRPDPGFRYTYGSAVG